MGTFVSNPTSVTPGLMVISPHTGRIMYWESASNAAVLGLPKQRQSGLQGAISGLMSGEQVTDVVNAEPSGVVVTLSSGRICLITLRDPQGKPTISANFLKNALKMGPTGLFGSLKSVLGGHLWKKDVAAARPGNSSQRGQRDVVLVSSSGLMEVWDTHWNGVNVLRLQQDIRDDVRHALHTERDDYGSDCDVKILDLITVPKDAKSASQSQSEEEPHQETLLFLLVLLLYGGEPRRMAVIKSSLVDNELEIMSTHELEPINAKSASSAPTPRLYVPKPLDTAFIVSSRAVTVLSLSEVAASPSAQLLMDVAPTPFQDRLQFRGDGKYEVIGCGIEDQSPEIKTSGCLVMVRGFGLIRIAALPREKRDDESELIRVTAKQKLEQAVFYGTMANNPLEFDSESDPAFSVEELEEAALEICDELLRSSSKFVPSATISLDQHLRLRSKAISDLGTELLRRRAPISRQARWEMLWAAEKLAAQRAMWKIEEGFRRRPDSSETFLSRVLESMADRFKTKFTPGGAAGNDHVRHWFIHDSFQMEHVIPWIFNTLRDSRTTQRSSPQFADYILQAGELSLAVLETAFRFREEHASNFGLEEEVFEDGVASSYKDLPEFWTSRSIVYSETDHLLDLELDSCRSWQQQISSKGEKPNESIASTWQRIAENSCRRLRVFGQMHNERVRWLSAQTEQKYLDESASLEETHRKQRKWQLFRAAALGQLRQAISLAEQFRDMEALVELMVEVQDQLAGVSAPPNERIWAKQDPVVANKTEFQQMIGKYFETFGEAWAEAFFGRQIITGQPGMMLSMSEYQPYVTRFLRKDWSRARLSWINDIIGESDYESASATLKKLALEHESKVWDKRVELSLAKLTQLAIWEKTDGAQSAESRDEIRKLDDLLETTGLQELIYDHISPALQGAIDRKAELQLAMEHFAQHIVGGRPALKELLEDALARVVNQEALTVEQAIDVLTLMDPVSVPEGAESPLLSREFHLALRFLRLSRYADTEPAYYEALAKLIWRRCMIRDDWTSMGGGQTQPKLDADVEAQVRQTALVRTLTECATEGKQPCTQKPPSLVLIHPLYTDMLEKEPNTQLYPRFTPSQILNSSNDILQRRFRPEQWPHIRTELEQENETLDMYIRDGKLETLFNDLVSLATKDASGIGVGAGIGAGNAGVPSSPTSPTRGGRERQGSSSTGTETVKTRLTWV